MIFRRELAEAVVDGRKDVTRRRRSRNPRSPWWEGGCAYTVGKVFTVNPGRGKLRICEAVVVSVRAERLGWVVDRREYEREGFASFAAFREAWEALNGDWDSLERVWRVEFEVVPR